MKHLTKLLVVAVALFAYSCATDTTEEIGVNAGGQTLITLTLEDSRTQLGELAGETYPLYWSEGDQISVNGVASTPLTASQAGKTSATFAVDGVHTDLNVAYPATVANKVLFASQQTHKDNTTFGKGVTTLYGVGSADEGVTLNHLTGVLKIGVTGSATLTHAQISTINRAPIAGAFAIDFTSGVVTPSKEATATINYSFGDGVALSSTPTYMHIAVPAGQYDELYVTLYDNANGVMYATVKAGESKPLTAGNVRIFSKAIAYAPNTVLYVVKDVASLKALPSATTDAVLICDIDLSNEDWTPLEGYSATLNGNGYAIKGLKAPLFGTTTASIKGLHLEGVNITSTGKAVVGALACHYKGDSLTNCSASGNLTVDLSGVTEYVTVGGMVGLVGQINSDGTNLVKSKLIENLTNNVNVEVDGDISANTTAGLNVGGFAGRVNVENATNILNNGNVTAKSTLKTGVTANYFGGTFGYFMPGTENVISNIANTGHITVGGTFAKKTQVAGCAGHFGFASNNTSLNGVSNSGNIKISKNTSVGGEFDVAGIAGVVAIKNTDNAKAVNSGNVTIEEGCTSTGSLYVGGCYGWTDKVITNLSNSGTLTISGGPYKDSRIGGVFGLTKQATSSVTNSGKLVLDGFSAGESYIGGCVGYESTQKTLDGLNNSGAIELKGVNTTAITLVGGCLATFNNDSGGTIKNSTNKGAIYVDNETTVGAQLIIAGCLARLNKHNSGKMVNLTNDAPITAEPKSTTTHLYVGGVGSYINGSNDHQNLINTAKGVITVKKTQVGGALEVAGVIAQVQDTTIELLNNGDVEVEGVSVKSNAIIAGVIAHPNNYARNDHENNGDVSVDATVTGYMCVGGVEGGSGNDIKTRFVNTGDINISSTTTVGSYMRVGGLTGYLTGTTQLASNDKGGCYNTGNVTFSGTAGDGGDSDTFYMGGAVGYITDSTTALVGSVESSGDVVFNGKHTGSAIATVGGVFGMNLGNISGMTSILYTGKKVECTGTSPNATTYIGGAVANSASAVNNASVVCDITAIDYSNVGIIMGNAYNEATKALNCKVGGSICTKEYWGEDPKTAEEALIKEVQKLSATTFHKYIYSTRNLEASVAEADGCSYISKIE